MGYWGTMCFVWLGAKELEWPSGHSFVLKKKNKKLRKIVPLLVFACEKKIALNLLLLLLLGWGGGGGNV